MNKFITALPPAIILGTSAFLLWSGLTNGHNWGDDFSSYIMQAKSITEGRPLAFIEENRFTIEQSSIKLGPIAYPWGFSALLAPIYALFGLNMLALKSVCAACFLLFLVSLWRGFQKYHSYFWRIILLCLFALNPTLLRFMDDLLSDIPFLLVSTVSVLLIGRVVIERRYLISLFCDQLLLGATIASAFFIRSNGILLLVTLGITQFIVLIRNVDVPEISLDQCSAGLKRLFPTKRAVVRYLHLNILPYVFFAIFVLAWQSLLPEGGSSHFFIMGGASLSSIKHNIHYYFNLPTEFFRGVPGRYWIYVATVPLAVAGAISRFRFDPHTIVYVTLTFLLYILWPPVQGLRFIFPALPFFVSFVVSSLEKCTHNIDQSTGVRLKKLICILPVVFVLLYFWKQSVSYAYDNIINNRASVSGPFVKTSGNMFSFIEENTKVESTVVFFKPRAMRMITGRRSLMINHMRDLSRGDYLCLALREPEAQPGQISPEEVRHLDKKGAIHLVYRNSDYAVYRLVK